MPQNSVQNKLADKMSAFATRRTVLSGTAIAVLGGLSARGFMTAAQASETDVTILNSAVSAEWQAIAAYELAGSSGLLTASVAGLAKTFQDHHKQHADALIGAVRALGGAAPVEPEAYDFSAHPLNNERDILEFAAGLEKGAVSAYLGAVPILEDRELAKVAASILGDEAMHWAVLRSALGQEPVPSAFVS
ncbi:ferritin-like domain-containing protein [Tepidicaulis sp. LMO-SS28]|uniref:ferritin-like domain-containing protein n=1 Tax=Tepidicaulis sp. LMO-SS28 TaxID=3447455 RepID=UPI003EDEA356